MKLTKLVLFNWQGYHGKKEFNFDGENGKSSSFIYAQNTYGKSAFWEAFHFALYGRVEIRRLRNTYRPVLGRESALAPMMNTDIYGTSGATFYVELFFTHKSSEYRLYRAFKPRYETSPVRAVNDLIPDVSLENLSVLGGDRYIANEDRWIEENLLPNRLAKFFLFDGERLEEYEDLMRKDEDIDLRNDIRDIIRTPIFKEGNRILKSSEARFGVKEGHEIVAQDKDKKLRLEFDKLTKEIDEARTSKEKVDKEKEGFKKELDTLENWLINEDKTKEASIKLEALKTEISDATEAIKGFKEDIQREMKDAWKVLIAPIVNESLEKLEVESESQKALHGDMALIKKEIKNLEHEVEGDPCDTCKRVRESPSKERKKEIDGIVLGLKKEFDDKKKHAKYPTPEEFFIKSNGLKNLKSDSTLDILCLKEEKLIIAKTKLRKAENNQKEQRKYITDEQNEKVKNVVKDKTDIENKIQSCNEDLSILKATIEGGNIHLRNFTENSDGNKNLTKKMMKLQTSRKIANALSEIFNTALENFSETMRFNVEKRASETFLEISNNRSNYKGLKITKDYAISIINKKGRKDIGSQGQSMVMAYSIIEALSSCSGFEFPMIIDTPGRSLSRSNMTHVFDYMTNSDRQVIFLPNDLELDPDEGDKRYGKLMASTYELGKDENDRTLVMPRCTENLRL